MNKPQVLLSLCSCTTPKIIVLEADENIRQSENTFMLFRHLIPRKSPLPEHGREHGAYKQEQSSTESLKSRRSLLALGGLCKHQDRRYLKRLNAFDYVPVSSFLHLFLSHRL